MTTRLSTALFCTLFLALPWHSVEADELDVLRKPTITVQGTGTVTTTPNLVFITIGVESQSATAVQALAQNSESMRNLQATLIELKIDKKDMQTSSLNISPVYQPQNPDRGQYDGNRAMRVVGYRVVNQLRIKSSDVANLGTLLDAVVKAGANTIHGIEFDSQSREEMTDEARRSAIRDARRRAQLLAEEAGVKVGSAIKIEDYAQVHHPVPMARMAMMADAAGGVPIAEGQQQITANVTVVFELLTSKE